MPEEFKNLLVITLVIVALFLIWAITIGITYWDVSRRKLSGGETFVWMVLVVLLPGIGFIAYLFSRLLGAVFSPGGKLDSNRLRITLQKRRAESELRTDTIPAVALVNPTLPDTRSFQEAEAPPVPQRMSYYLVVIEGPQAGQEYFLTSFPVHIGRGPEAGIRLDGDLSVSRKHAEIYETFGVLRIRDLKSTHGTYVNDFSIDDKSLEPGDRIRVGVSILVVGVKEIREIKE